MPEKPREGFNPIKIDKKALEAHGLFPHDAETIIPIRGGGRGDEDTGEGIERIGKRKKRKNEDAEGVQSGRRTRRVKKGDNKKDDSALTPPPEPASVTPSESSPEVESPAVSSPEYRWDYRDLREKIFNDVQDPDSRRELLSTLDRIDSATPLREQFRATIERGVEYARAHEAVWDPFSPQQSVLRNLEKLADMAGIPAEEVERIKAETLREKQFDLEAFQKERQSRKREQIPGEPPAHQGRLQEELGFALRDYFSSIKTNAEKGRAEPDPEIRKKIRMMRGQLIDSGMNAEDLDRFWDTRADEEFFDWEIERKRAADKQNEVSLSAVSRVKRIKPRNMNEKLLEAAADRERTIEHSRTGGFGDEGMKVHDRNVELNDADYLRKERTRIEIDNTIGKSQFSEPPAEPSRVGDFPKEGEPKTSAAPSEEFSAAYQDAYAKAFSYYVSPEEKAAANKTLSLLHDEALREGIPGDHLDYLERLGEQRAREADDLRRKELESELKKEAGEVFRSLEATRASLEDLKARLESARDALAAAENDKHADEEMKENALRRYLEARQEYVAGDTERYLSEKFELLKKQAEGEPGRFEKTRQLWKRTAEKWNLAEWTGVGKEGSFLKRYAGRAVNARSATSALLLGIGTFAGGPVGWAAFGVRQALVGIGAGFLSYELMRRAADAMTVNVSEEKLQEMSPEDIEEKMLGMAAYAKVNSAWQAVEPAFQKMLDAYREKTHGLAIDQGYITGGADIFNQMREFKQEERHKKESKLGRQFIAGATGVVAMFGIPALREWLGYKDFQEAPQAVPNAEFPKDHEFGEALPKQSGIPRSYEDAMFELQREKARIASWQIDPSAASEAVTKTAPINPAVAQSESLDFSYKDFDDAKVERSWEAPQDFETERTEWQPHRDFADEPIEAAGKEGAEASIEQSDEMRKLAEAEARDEIPDETGVASEQEAPRENERVPVEADETEGKGGEPAEAREPREILPKEIEMKSGLKKEYFNLVKDMSVEEYLEKRGITLKRGKMFPFSKTDSEYPWIRQEGLAHNRWMEYLKLQKLMQGKMKAFSKDEREDAEGMSVEEFIKKYLIESHD